jgi:hypothetical protein
MSGVRAGLADFKDKHHLICLKVIAENTEQEETVVYDFRKHKEGLHSL